MCMPAGREKPEAKPQQSHRDASAPREATVAKIAGSQTGSFPPDRFDELREEWPD